MKHKATPLHRPTNLDPLYPDPWGKWEELCDDRADRIASRLIRVLIWAIGFWLGWTLAELYGYL